MELSEALVMIHRELQKRAVQRDTRVFELIAQSLDEAIIPEIEAYIESERGAAQRQDHPTAIAVDMQPAAPQIAGAVALALCGPAAKAAFLRMLEAETVPIVANHMLKEAAGMQQPWFLNVLLVVAEDERYGYAVPEAKRLIQEDYGEIIADRIQTLEQGDAAQQKEAQALMKQYPVKELMPRMIERLADPDTIQDTLAFLTSLRNLSALEMQMAEQHDWILEQANRYIHTAEDDPVFRRQLEMLVTRLARSPEVVTPLADWHWQRLQSADATTMETRLKALDGFLIKAQPRLSPELLERFRDYLRERHAEPAYSEPVERILRSTLKDDPRAWGRQCATCGATDTLKVCPHCEKVFCKEHAYYEYCSQACHREGHYKRTGTYNPRYW